MTTMMKNESMMEIEEPVTPEEPVTLEEPIIPEPVTPEEPVILVQLLKKYRAATYDEHDRTYATQMKKYVLPEAFDKFTDGLMHETHINRFSLLEAIDDYLKTQPKEQLPCAFTDSAFNYRPYQPCTIS